MTTENNTDISSIDLLAVSDRRLDQIDQHLKRTSALVLFALSDYDLNPNSYDEAAAEQLSQVASRFSDVITTIQGTIIELAPLLGLTIEPVSEEGTDKELTSGSVAELSSGSSEPAADSAPVDATPAPRAKRSPKKSGSNATAVDGKAEVGQYGTKLIPPTELPSVLPTDAVIMTIDPKTSILSVDGNTMVLTETQEFQLVNALITKGSDFIGKADFVEFFGGDSNLPARFSDAIKGLNDDFASMLGVDLCEKNDGTRRGLKYRLNPQVVPIDKETYEAQYPPKV